ncbi:uncharacterized protein LOC127780395 [Oryza glaberrima]|uniref:uncharacterized protein LOC127780395 n=1 Tax=Oryza glaberrima TaxID=4538 RepID=UPI00224C51B6|nr:uncharacterized protein LOC127780395 [Oryza glaberrima]
MMGTAVELGRRHGGDHRFYDASRVRRGYHHHGLPKARWAPAVHQEKAAEEPSPSPARAPVPPPGVAGNLERFVAAVTPFVPAQFPSKMQRAARGWRGCGVDAEREEAPHFFLRDVWEAYREWSAYGAGVPLVLDGCDGVVQYYVPYLSAIQLYGDPAVLRLSSGPRHMMDDSDGEYHDSSSDASSDYELGRVKHLTQEGFSSDDGESGDLHGRLLFQYLEFDSPFCREPLTDKISSLSARFPGLRTLRSCDLSPRSWISVAWYPIYRIPTGPTLKDLDACFLTFHRLSTGPEEDNGGAVKYWGPGSKPTIPLSVFGMASYKFSNSIWSSTDGDRQLASFLQQAASDWLRDSRTSHPDYQFFASRGAYHR